MTGNRETELLQKGKLPTYREQGSEKRLKICCVDLAVPQGDYNHYVLQTNIYKNKD